MLRFRLMVKRGPWVPAPAPILCRVSSSACAGPLIEIVVRRTRCRGRHDPYDEHRIRLPSKKRKHRKSHCARRQIRDACIAEGNAMRPSSEKQERAANGYRHRQKRQASCSPLAQSTVGPDQYGSDHVSRPESFLQEIKDVPRGDMRQTVVPSHEYEPEHNARHHWPR